jgi:hypothetical protein
MPDARRNAPAPVGQGGPQPGDAARMGVGAGHRRRCSNRIQKPSARRRGCACATAGRRGGEETWRTGDGGGGHGRPPVDD